MFRRPDRTTAPLPALLPAFALALTLALALLRPAPLAAADILQETLKAKAQTEQEQQKTISQGISLTPGQDGQQQAAPKRGKAFPGPVLQPGTQSPGQANARTDAPQPANGASPKNGKAMYGDIVIHK